ncbi:MAG: DUF4395 domain-containing protein [Sandaracinaceae bacterium]|nr:DUF4395 domain-containing protein [Sandaracinaceae bacterium]
MTTATATAAAFCPVSLERVDHNAVRVTGLLTVAMLAAYAISGWAVFAIVLAADYTVRAWTGGRSPMQRLGGRIARGLGIPALMQDKAPKQFAARIGWMFAVAASVLAFVSPTAGIVVGLSLLGFNVLDSVFDFCVGCWTYIHMVLPLSARFGR